MADSLSTCPTSQAQPHSSHLVRNLESSQLPASQHDIYLLRFLSLPVTYQMVAYIAAFTNAIVDEVLHTLPNPPEAPNGGRMPDLEDFILHVCRQTNVSTPTLMVSVIYLSRLRNCMPYQALAMPGTAHRLFLAALIIASKFSNDTCPRNKTWVHASGGLFDIEEVNLMEKQFLLLLDYDLLFDEEEAIWHFQPVIEVLGANLHDIESYSKAKRESNIKHAPPPMKKAVLSPEARSSNDSYPQVQRHQAIIDDGSEADRLETRSSALRRVARGSQERMERLPQASSRHHVTIATPAPVLVAPPRASSSRALSSVSSHDIKPPAPLGSRPSRSSIRPTVSSLSISTHEEYDQSSRSQSFASTSNLPSSNSSKRSSALSAMLARAPSTDSVSSDSAGGLTADEGTSSSSSSASMTSEDDAEQDDDDGAIHVVAALQIDMDQSSRASHHVVGVEDMTGIGASASAKKKLYGALQNPEKAPSTGRHHPRFSWSRRRSETLKSGAPVPAPSSSTEDYYGSPDQPRMDRQYHHQRNRSSAGSVIDLNLVASDRHRKTSLSTASSSRHYSSRSSRSAFSSSTGTIVCPSDLSRTVSTAVINPPSIGAAPANRHASTATITPQSHSHVLSFESMGIPITTASASNGGGKQSRSQRQASFAAGTGVGSGGSGTKGSSSGGMALSISASIKSFLTGGGSDRERERERERVLTAPGATVRA